MVGNEDGEESEEAVAEQRRSGNEAAGLKLGDRHAAWSAKCAADQAGPSRNQGDALDRGISELLEQLPEIHATIEEHPRLLWHDRPGSDPERF